MHEFRPLIEAEARYRIEDRLARAGTPGPPPRRRRRTLRPRALSMPDDL